jgi:perosamine synthetase
MPSFSLVPFPFSLDGDAIFISLLGRSADRRRVTMDIRRMRTMKIGRTVPPAAAPLDCHDLWHGILGSMRPERTRRAREQEIREAFGVTDVFLVSSGSAALKLTLTALTSLSPRTEVVIPAYTCFSVPAAILHAGLRPVLCDINPTTFDFNHELLLRALNDNTLCVVAHHLFGVPSEIERLRALCEVRGVFLLEDAAQAMGAEHNGRRLGTLGDVGIFSLGRGKNITCGSGGIIVTSTPRIADAVRRRYAEIPSASPAEAVRDFVKAVLMTIFVRPRLYWIPAAMPFLHLGETIFPTRVPVRRLSGMNAGLLRNWRSRLTGSNRVRSEMATYFSHRLPLRLARGGAYPYLRLPFFVKNPAEKQKLYLLSRARGLGLSAAYPSPVSDIPGVPLAPIGQQFPCARRVAASLVTIPTHHLLSERDRDAIAELCRDFRSA